MLFTSLFTNIKSRFSGDGEPMWHRITNQQKQKKKGRKKGEFEILACGRKDSGRVP